MFSIQELIYSYQFKLNLDTTFSTILNFNSNNFSLSLNHFNVIRTAQNESIIGFSNIFNNSIAVNSVKLTSSNFITTQSESTANALAIGINNLDSIITDQGNNNILGIATASNLGIAFANIRKFPNFSSVDSKSVATTIVTIDAVGISNLGKIELGQGHDSIIGVAKATGFGIAKSGSQSSSIFGNKSLVDLNSESLVVVDTLSIGVDNHGELSTGKGDDIIIGFASNFAVSRAMATSFASNLSETFIDDVKIFDDATIDISNSQSTAIAEIITNTLGIINHDVIVTGVGNDTIMGMANNENFSEALTITEAKSFAQDIATVQVDSSSLAIARGHVVGIANQGEIYTGKGNDTIVGFTLNMANAVANADADAIANADNSNSQTNTTAIADTSEVIDIGIDNTFGLIETGEGNDKIIGYGAVGIQGGHIETGKGNDKIIGYGDLTGIEDSNVALGKGDDYFKAAIVNLEPLIEDSLLTETSRSIKNTTISGGLGNDLFEIESFAAGVSIDGGIGNDILKLSGNIEDYTITLGSSEYQIIRVQNNDSTLVVKDTEIFYFGTNDFAYDFSDLV